MLYSGGGRGDHLFGGKGKDQFWIDGAPESKVKIMDFSSQDRIVFNISDSDLLVKNNQRSASITTSNGISVKLVGFPEFSVEKYALFESFETV